MNRKLCLALARISCELMDRKIFLCNSGKMMHKRGKIIHKKTICTNFFQTRLIFCLFFVIYYCMFFILDRQLEAAYLSDPNLVFCRVRLIMLVFSVLEFPQVSPMGAITPHIINLKGPCLFSHTNYILVL